MSDSNEVVRDVDSQVDKIVKNLLLSKKTQNESQTRMPNIKAMREFKFLTPNAKEPYD